MTDEYKAEAEGNVQPEDYEGESGSEGDGMRTITLPNEIADYIAGMVDGACCRWPHMRPDRDQIRADLIGVFAQRGSLDGVTIKPQTEGPF